jgi:hypothetical protein
MIMFPRFYTYKKDDFNHAAAAITDFIIRLSQHEREPKA